MFSFPRKTVYLDRNRLQTAINALATLTSNAVISSGSVPPAPPAPPAPPGPPKDLNIKDLEKIIEENFSFPKDKAPLTPSVNSVGSKFVKSLFGEKSSYTKDDVSYALELLNNGILKFIFNIRNKSANDIGKLWHASDFKNIFENDIMNQIPVIKSIIGKEKKETHLLHLIFRYIKHLSLSDVFDSYTFKEKLKETLEILLPSFDEINSDKVVVSKIIDLINSIKTTFNTEFVIPAPAAPAAPAPDADDLLKKYKALVILFIRMPTLNADVFFINDYFNKPLNVFEIAEAAAAAAAAAGAAAGAPPPPLPEIIISKAELTQKNAGDKYMFDLFIDKVINLIETGDFFKYFGEFDHEFFDEFITQLNKLKVDSLNKIYNEIEEKIRNNFKLINDKFINDNIINKKIIAEQFMNAYAIDLAPNDKYIYAYNVLQLYYVFTRTLETFVGAKKYEEEDFQNKFIALIEAINTAYSDFNKPAAGGARLRKKLKTRKMNAYRRRQTRKLKY